MDCLAESGAPPGGTLVCHVLALGQRHSSRPVPACVDPNFADDSFLISLPPHGSVFELAEAKNLFHVVVVQHGDDDESAIVGAQSVEWRQVLVSGFLNLNIELAAVGGDAAVPTGVLTIQLEILPRLEGKGQLDEATIKQQVDALA